MRGAWLLLILMTGCVDKEAGDDSGTPDDTSHTGDSDTNTDCPEGPGFVEGILLGSDGLALDSGKVKLFDSTGSDELVSDNVDTDGSFHLVYGRGDYVMRGEYATCVGEDIPVTICGDQTVYENIQLSCWPPAE